MDLTESRTEWVKFGHVVDLALVGKDYVAVGSGCHMNVTNVLTKEEYVYHAHGRGDVGEGIGIVTGHKSLPFLAFSERKRFPRVFIMACPSFVTVCVLDKQTNEDYLAMGFSEGEYLVTLNANPSYEIIVWNWRTGARIASMGTHTPGRSQIIRCNLSTPVYFAQVTTGRKRLYVWDIAVCGRKCVLTPHYVTPAENSDNYSDVLWTSEETLLILDTQGHVYAMDVDYNLKKIINWENKGEERKLKMTSFNWYKNGLAIVGPSGQVRHYTKASGEWTNDWSAKSELRMLTLYCSSKDMLISVSTDEEIMLFNYAELNFTYLKQFQTSFNDVCLIYPVGEYFVTLQHNREVISWELSTGQLKDVYILQHRSLVIKENPEYPYVGVGYDHGVLELLSVYDPNSIKTMTYFNLSKNQINSIYFTKIGKLIVAADTDVGEFFVIEGIPGSQMSVIATLEAQAQICDYMLVASRTCMRLFAIVVTSNCYIAGNKLVRFCVIRGEPACEVKEYQLKKPDMLLSKIYVTSKPNRDRAFHVIPLAYKCIFEFTTKRGDPMARVTDAIHTEHLMKKVCLHTDQYHAITYAYDGLIIARTPDFGNKRLAVVMPHYRTLGGVEKAYLDPLGKYFLSLGRDNTLVCTSLTDTTIDDHKKEELRELLLSERMVSMFERKTGGFTPKGSLADTTWKEYAFIELKRAEFKKCKIERNSILDEFKSIQAEVSRLLTANLEGPENELLNVQEFNLDVDLQQQKIKESKDECTRTRVYLECLIAEQDKVSKWIKSYCWDSMSTKAQSIRGIFANLQVDSYPLLPEEKDPMWEYTMQYRLLESRMAVDDSFQPWLPQSEDALCAKLKKEPTIAELDEGVNLLDILGEEEEEEVKKIDEDTYTAMRGTMTHLFVPLEEYHYTQEELKNLFQTKIHNLYSKIERFKLKEYFNKKFKETMVAKEREMTLLQERNAKLRHILSELNYFSVEQIYIDVEDPPWHHTERPETILKVEDNEVTITPYISPSEQAILDAQAAEAERIRLLLLADNFRELALIEMMNGVLEVRWEDELRKDVPKPKCMLEKDPEKYNEEDLRSIMQYEEDVKFLISERERYKKILEVDYGKIGNYLRDGVKKFNKRLSEFFITKMQVDMGIRQEALYIERARTRDIEKINRLKQEKAIYEEIRTNYKKIEAIQSLINTLNDSVRDLRNYVNDVLMAKEKALEKAFKKEFSDSSPVVQEQAAKLLKKRPKVNIRTLISPSLTLELARCVPLYEKSIILTQECQDYLKALNTLDQYVGIPPAIDEITFAAICRHRRLKIESDLKIKASQLEITEGDATILTFQKLLAHRKAMSYQYLTELDQIRQDNLVVSQNMNLQLVLRSGIVEIPLTGEMSDFRPSIMVNRKDVELINKIIIKGGQRKIKAMKEFISFRQNIRLMEWQHKRLRMQIEDIETYLHDIDSVTLTKGLQSFLKFKARGQTTDKSTFEEELEAIKNSYQKIIDDRKYKVHELQRQINALKKNTKEIDTVIVSMNVDVCEFQLQRDYVLERMERNIIKTKNACLLKRAQLVKQIQTNHSEMLVLETELELLRLKTYPTLSYTIFP